MKRSEALTGVVRTVLQVAGQTLTAAEVLARVRTLVGREQTLMKTVAAALTSLEYSGKDRICVDRSKHPFRYGGSVSVAPPPGESLYKQTLRRRADREPGWTVWREVDQRAPEQVFCGTRGAAAESFERRCATTTDVSDGWFCLRSPDGEMQDSDLQYYNDLFFPFSPFSPAQRETFLAGMRKTFPSLRFEPLEDQA